MSTIDKEGPLTFAELQSLWVAAVDEGYSQPLIDAGDGNGLEVYSQQWVQFERVSQAIDTTTQSMYLRPWSGQSGPSAAGAANSTVTLTITRTGLPSKLLVLLPGYVFVLEEEPDYAPDAGVVVATGRRYTLVEPLVFHPGDSGPFNALAVAEFEGKGYDNAMPGSITTLDQSGSQLNNTNASVRLVTPVLSPDPADALGAIVDGVNRPDVFLPQHVGQYVQLTAGANAGQVGRVTAYFPPDLTAAIPTGGSVKLAVSASVKSFTGDYTSTFVDGEIVQLVTAGPTIVGYGVVLGERVYPDGSKNIAFDIVSGVLGTGIIGETSAATATIDVVLVASSYVAETLTASWRVLDWLIDWGATSTNAQSPSGGRLAMLDELGAERGVYRAPGEPDSVYLDRVTNLNDTVSPNAIKRAINRALRGTGLTYCFREMGTSALPGFFFDAGGSAAGDSTHGPDPLPNPANNYAYDMDFTVRPADRYKLMMSFRDMRAYFIVAIAPTPVGGTGLAYDGSNADAFPLLNGYDLPDSVALSYDGYETTNPLYGMVFRAVDTIRAGGVGWDLLPDNGPCP